MLVNVYGNEKTLGKNVVVIGIGRGAEAAPYPVIETQRHEYGTLFMFLGVDSKDPTNLGAEVELSLGPEKEKHTINKSALIYVPADLEHGSFKVTKANKPFNFLEIVTGPELPGAVY